MEKNERRLNLEGIMYDREGRFIPRNSNHGIISEDLANLRDTYMEAEREYFECLLANERLYEKFVILLEKDSEELFKMAMRLQEELETGELESAKDKEKMSRMTFETADKYHMKKLEETEALICLLLAAAADKAKINVKNRYFHEEEEEQEELGMHRSR